MTGVYFQWHNEPANPNVKDWNVTELRVGLLHYAADIRLTDNGATSISRLWAAFGVCWTEARSDNHMMHQLSGNAAL